MSEDAALAKTGLFWNKCRNIKAKILIFLTSFSKKDIVTICML